jgi:hypothetical protein
MSTCRICGCTDTDCTWCVVLTGERCHWTEPDLCSACAGFGMSDEERARNRGEFALKKARKRSGRAPGFLPLSDHGRRCLRVAIRIQYQRLKASV